MQNRSSAISIVNRDVDSNETEHVEYTRLLFVIKCRCTLSYHDAFYQRFKKFDLMSIVSAVTWRGF